MQAKMIIEKGKTRLVLYPENDFEDDMLEKLTRQGGKYDLSIDVEDDSPMMGSKGPRIEIEITEKDDPKKLKL